MTATTRSYLKWVCILHFSLSAVLCAMKCYVLFAGTPLPAETFTGELLKVALYTVAAGIGFVLYRDIQEIDRPTTSSPDDDRYDDGDPRM